MLLEVALIALLAFIWLVADGLVQPRGWVGLLPRSWPGSALSLGVAACVFGLFLTFSGAPLASAIMTMLLGAALTLSSNIKRTVLGEPLVFSDLALIGAIFRHPQFYFSALRGWQIAMLILGGVAALVLLVNLFVATLLPHLLGLAVFTASSACLWLFLHLPPWSRLAQCPDPDADVARHGLVASLLLHWHRWRQTADPPPNAGPAPKAANEDLLIIVQCESFADPAELFADPCLAMAGLTAARTMAWAHGRLLVPGFGAYTMRTEYGVIFGRSEAELGFRRFDPFLTAIRETSYALPNQLAKAGWRSLFLHPHDMRFYGRDKIMPAAGFTALLGQDAFRGPAPGEGRYVTDAAITQRIIALAHEARQPTCIYAVTIENHGPWPPDQSLQRPQQSSAYLKLVRNGDAMLSALIAALSSSGKRSTLVFFGDHRPSIPGLSMPSSDRHTPYVIVRFDADGVARCRPGQPVDLTPAELHRQILNALDG